MTRPLFDEQLVRRVFGEFVEMPGLQLTRPQARRLWGLDDETCAVLLGSVRYEIVSIDDVRQRHEYLELKVKSIFMVRPLPLVTACIEPLALSELTTSTTKAPSVDICWSFPSQ